MDLVGRSKELGRGATFCERLEGISRVAMTGKAFPAALGSTPGTP